MGAWQEEKEELDLKKMVIFAERKDVGGDRTWGEFFTGLPYIMPGGKDPDEVSGYAKRIKTAEGEFVPQAKWWVDQHGGDYDPRIVDFRGEDQLRAKLKELYDSGYFDDGDMDAIIMGHADDDAMYGGIMPKNFGGILDEFDIGDKFDDVILGSCGMGGNPIACMNVSAAFDGADVYGQGNPDMPEFFLDKWKNRNTDSPFYKQTEMDVETNWSYSPEWGSASIDQSKIDDPNVPLAERVLTKNAPIRSYSFDPSDPKSIEARRLMKKKMSNIERKNERLANELDMIVDKHYDERERIMSNPHDWEEITRQLHRYYETTRP